MKGRDGYFGARGANPRVDRAAIQWLVFWEVYQPLVLIHRGTASITPASRRKTKINTVVDEICGRASGSGLRQAQCSAILRILIESKHVDQASRSAVIKSLYPLQDPSVDDQLLIIGSLGLGDGKPSLQTQSALLRWITLMFNLLHDIKTLQRCYSVLFNLLDMMALRFVQENYGPTIAMFISSQGESMSPTC